MKALLSIVRNNRLLWLLVLVPLPLIGAIAMPEAHSLLFLLSIAGIVPLAALLSIATEAVAAKTGDAVGGLLNATLGNLTELIMALTALRAGEYLLVKATIAGAIVANCLFMMGAAFLIGGLKHKMQSFNLTNANFQLGILFLATFTVLIPSAIGVSDRQEVTVPLSAGLAVLLIVTYGLGLFYSLVTHRAYFASDDHGDEEELMPVGVAVGVLVAVTVLVALVSEVFIESLTGASEEMGLTPAFVGFVVVALVGAAAEMAAAFSAAAKDRLDLSVGIAFGSAAQISLFVAPVLMIVSFFIGPHPMTLQFWPGAVLMMFIAVLSAFIVTSSGKSTWFAGVLMLMIYAVFAMTLYMLPITAEVSAVTGG
jgi:Ca2+:H+ antiporter